MPALETATGQRLYYECIAGGESLPHLVFLHEGLGCTRMWRDFPERLCRLTGCPGLVYDRLGYGKSSPLSEKRTIHYLHDYALMELPLVVDKLLGRRPFILVGHSDGGSIALIYGARVDARLLGIITEAAHAHVDEETLAGIAAAEEAWHRGKMRGLERYHGERCEKVFMDWAVTWQSSWFRAWSIEYLLPAIKAPLLVIQGEDDPYGTRAQVDAIVSGAAGEAHTHLVEGCGHIPHFQAPEAVLASMGNFIADIVKQP